MEIGLAIGIVTVLGILGAVILVLAAKFMSVEQDPRIGEVEACLPGANCGACGFAGCGDYARAVVEKGASVDRCIPGGAGTAQAVAAVMGTKAGEVQSCKAVVRCQGITGACGNLYEYEGTQTCAAAAGLYGGPSACAFGCLGFGDCVKACPFDALSIQDGIAHVDSEKCTGCGICVQVCPHKVIQLAENTASMPRVLCSNTEKGAQVMKNCTAGCIGCGKCARVCEQGAIQMVNQLPSIDDEKCIGCGACAEACPKQVIVLAR